MNNEIINSIINLHIPNQLIGKLTPIFPPRVKKNFKNRKIYFPIMSIDNENVVEKLKSYVEEKYKPRPIKINKIIIKKGEK